MGIMARKWDEAWKCWTVSLVPYKFNPKFLEGANAFSRDIMRRAIVRGVIHNQKQYDELLMTVSEWGYCVETPAEFQFA
jgi:hypothetical protein